MGIVIMNVSILSKTARPVQNDSDLPPEITLKNVVKDYITEAGSFTALKGIDLDIAAGEFIGIIGKSGAGKSTLLNMISAVDHLTGGEVWVGNTQIHALSQTQLSRWRGRNVGVVYQTFQLMPMLTLLDNILLPIDFLGRYHPLKSVERAMSLLADLDIAEHAYKFPSQISGGQQQRVAIARALANDPAIILADEPTGSLDSATAATTMAILKNLGRRGKTIIMATHDSSLTHYFTRTVILCDGEVVDEALARLFPMVSHEKLITAGHNFSRGTYSPGQPILAENGPIPGLLMVIRGKAETTRNGEKVQFCAGEMFGERELVGGDPNPASIVAGGSTTVEIGCLSRSCFVHLYEIDSGFRREIDRKIASKRYEQR